MRASPTVADAAPAVFDWLAVAHDTEVLLVALAIMALPFALVPPRPAGAAA